MEYSTFINTLGGYESDEYTEQIDGGGEISPIFSNKNINDFLKQFLKHAPERGCFWSW